MICFDLFGTYAINAVGTATAADLTLSGQFRRPPKEVIGPNGTTLTLLEQL